MPHSLPVPLPQAFYDRSPRDTAIELLGKSLVRKEGIKLTIGRIVETEAYLAANDPACHANRGRTPRNAAMFGPPGTAYVYMIHAKWCFNAVTEAEGLGSAVLIRAVEPRVGEDIMQIRRGDVKPLDLARGPARLCQAFAIDRTLNEHDLTRECGLWIGESLAPNERPPAIHASSRIGISTAQELQLRFYYAGNRFVSGPRNQSGRLITEATRGGLRN